MHGTYRVNKGGAGSFDQIMRAWKTLHGHGVDVNILCTINAANGDHPLEVYRFFRDELQARYMQFIPIVERTTQELLPLANLGWGDRTGADRPLYTQQGALGLEKLDNLPKYCRECEVRFACHGECPRNRFITTPDGEPGLNYLCAGYKQFFNHIDPAMKTMAALLRQGRFADEI